tara:strand:- start:1273 stop:1785 length:513 start_codon:yes stop_codon:yes gene_type:complete
MAVNNPKISFNVDEPQTIRLLFDTPKLITNDYGESYMYKVEQNGAEKVLFATPTLNASLNMYGKNAEVIITKVLIDDKYNWTVESDSPKETPSQVEKKLRQTFVPDDEASLKSPDWDDINYGKCFYGFMLKAFEMKMPLDNDTVEKVRDWTNSSWKREVTIGQNNSELPF